MDKPQTIQKTLVKTQQLKRSSDLSMSIAREFVITDEKIEQLDKKIDTKKEEIVKELKIDEGALALKIQSQIRVPEDGKPGDKGDDYILTEDDKKEIAKTIKVPVVEKIIEKTTEVIREQPIVTNQITNEVKEVAVTDQPLELVKKLESLKDDDRLDASAIKNLPEAGSHQTAAFGVREAPKDGKIYGRKNRAWVETEGDTDEKVKLNASDPTADYLAVKHEENVSISKAITYNIDGTLNVVTDAKGTKTMAYNVDGTLASITGTGIYKNKTFAYSGGVLTAITV